MAAPRRLPPRPFPHTPSSTPSATSSTALTGWANDLRAPSPTLRIDPAACTTACITTATVTLTVCLLLTQYYPGRFRIHPLPYVSDAGLRDPERFLLGAGLSVSGALFLPLALAVRLHQRSLLPSLPPRVPLIAAFALCGAVWGGVSVGTLWLVSGGGGGDSGWGAPPLAGAGVPSSGGAAAAAVSAAAGTGLRTDDGAGAPACSRTRHVTLAVYLSALLCAVIVVFVAVWATVRLDMPPRIKNKDKRFVAMAVLEYIGTGCFLSILAVLAAEVRGRVLVISLGDARGGRAS